jgi:membrane-associated protease RseP (regulator of RpoE activity)
MRSQLPAEIDLSSRAHRAAIRAIYQGHPGGKIDEARFDRFYQAQVSWDETMAESAAGALAAAPPGSTLVVLAGSMHVKGFLGIPERVRRRNGLDYRVVLPLERDAFPEAGIPLGMGRPADYVLFTEPTPSEPAGRLGVELRGGDATVKTVVQYGAADKAGLQAGDVLLSLDGAPVADVVDLRLALEGRTAGSTVRLRWRRDGEEREAVATLAAPAPFAPPPPAPKDPPPAEEPPK